MREVECKVLEVDVPALKRKLRMLGARCEGTRKLVAVHLDTKDRFFSRNGCLVRLRTDGGPSILTFKVNAVKKSGIKSAHEREIALGSFRRSLQVLKGMGLEPTLTLVKRRTTYEIDGARLEIDKYLGQHTHIPAFLEIEAPSKKGVLSAAKKLGYSQKDLCPYDTYDLIKRYSKLGR
ncbi:MAG: CYTH domain-containing protein [Candidatus Micrarchaeota archaeon]|nr:CYTH domain-containing protein [Candidatus Micrarchaeota archaeon]